MPIQCAEQFDLAVCSDLFLAFIQVLLDVRRRNCLETHLAEYFIESVKLPFTVGPGFCRLAGQYVRSIALDQAADSTLVGGFPLHVSVFVKGELIILIQSEPLLFAVNSRHIVKSTMFVEHSGREVLTH